MTKPIKAALLSALVFPGFGHLWLKKIASGITLMLSFSVALYFFIINIVRGC